MDINGLNKSSVTELFSKLTNHLQTEGNVFAGLLSRVGVDGLLAKNAILDGQSKPVENNAAKLRGADSSVNDTKKTSFTEKNKDVRKTDNKKTVSNEDVRKSASRENTQSVENSQEAEKNENTRVRENVAAVPVENVLVPMESVENNGTLDNLLVVDGNAVENGGVEVFDVTSGDVSVLSPESADDRAGDEINLLASAKIENLATKPEVENGVGDAASSVQVKTDVSTDKIKGSEDKVLSVESSEKDALSVVSAANSEKMSGSLSSADALDSVVDAKNVNEDTAEDLPVSANEIKEQKEVSFVARNESVKQNAAVYKAEDEQGNVSKDKELEAQAAELSERLDGKSLQVKVDVKEEKIAYHNSRDLIKNSAALDEVVAALDKADGESRSLPEMLSPAQNAAITNVSAQAAVVPNPMVGTVEENVVSNAVEVAKVSLNGNGAAQAAAGGIEYVDTLKATANSKSNETSFRDVLKGMSKEAVEQVKVNITKSAVKGVDSINVRLKPAELGHIEVKMQIKDGKLQAQIISSRPETMEALQREAQALEKAFNEAGFQTDENSLSFSWRNDGQQAGQNQSRENPLRSFIGEVFETEANNEILSAEAANQNWSAEKGLNIKV